MLNHLYALKLLLLLLAVMPLQLNANQLVRVKGVSLSPTSVILQSYANQSDVLLNIITGDEAGGGLINRREEIYRINEQGRAKLLDEFRYAFQGNGPTLRSKDFASDENFAIFTIGFKVSSFNKKTNKVEELLDLPDESLVDDIVKISDRFLFTVERADGNIELWSTLGKRSNTVLVKRLEHSQGPEVFLGGFFEKALFPNKLIFSYPDANVGEELFVSDGTPSGTRLIKDIIPGLDPPPINTPLSGSPKRFTLARGRVFFIANVNGFMPSSLWVTDGTAAGTNLINSVPNSIREMIGAIDGGVLFQQINGSATQLWFSDGSVTGTGPIGNVSVDSLVFSGSSGNSVYFLSLMQSGNAVTVKVFRVDSNLSLVEVARLNRQVSDDINAVNNLLVTDNGGIYFDLARCDNQQINRCRIEILHAKGNNISTSYTSVPFITNSGFSPLDFDKAASDGIDIYVPVLTKQDFRPPKTQLFSTREFKSTSLPFLLLLED